MISALIWSTILGVVYVMLSLQNQQVTAVQIFGYSFALPLYMFSALVFLLGIAVTLVFHLFDNAASFLDIQNRDQRIREYEKMNEQLEHDVYRLTQENLELNDLLDAKSVPQRNLLSRVRHHLA